MLAIALVLLYLAIGKSFEPLLLIPIAFGMLCTNLLGADMFHEILFAGGHVQWGLLSGAPITEEWLAQMAGAGVSDAVLSQWSLAMWSRRGSWTICIWESSWESIRA